MTKAPFNALPAVYDLNSAFLSFALTGYDGWLSSAGYIGPKVRVDHDISMLVPELFSRMNPDERTAANLIKEGYPDSARKFALEANIKQGARDDESMSARVEIKKAIHSGQIQAAIEKINELNPEVCSLPLLSPPLHMVL